MVKQGIKNYIKNLKYVFTPLGAIALGFVFGLSLLIPGIVRSASALATRVYDILNDASIDFTALKDSLVAAVKALDWSSPIESVQTILTREWLMTTLHECLDALVDSAEVYTVQVNSAVTDFISSVAAFIVLWIFFTLLGALGGFFITKWLVRRNMAKRALWKFFFISLLDSVISTVLVAVCVWLFALWRPSIFITAAIALLLFGIVSLFEAYITHAFKKLAFKEVVNIKKALLLALTDIIIFVTALAFTLIVTFITNTVVGVFVGSALMEIAFIVIGLNAEAYVKTTVARREEEKKAELSATESVIAE